MLGFMNKEAYDKTVETKKVTFWSRTRNCLWTKGETSGNVLNLVSIQLDCDNDTLLVKVHPVGPTCHKGTDTCWGESNEANPLLFLTELQDFINKRHEEMPEGSYQSVQRRTQPYGTKGGRRSVGSCDRGDKRNQRAPHLRSIGHVLSPHCAANKQGIAYRRHSKGVANAPRPQLA